MVTSSEVAPGKVFRNGSAHLPTHLVCCKTRIHSTAPKLFNHKTFLDRFFENRGNVTWFDATIPITDHVSRRVFVIDDDVSCKLVTYMVRVPRTMSRSFDKRKMND